MARTHSTPVFENAMRDLRYAARSFRRTPLAALTIVVTVGLGLGLVAAVYTILNTMVFKVDDVYKPHELFGVERQQSGNSVPETFSLAEYETFLRETDIFTDAFASTTDIKAWFDGVRREGRLVTGNFFQVLGVNAELGRVFGPPDDDAASPPVIVLSHRAWTQYFGGDPAVLERSYRVNGTAFRIAGVMPENFRGLEVIAAPDFWAPIAHADIFSEPGVRVESRSGDGLNVVGRLTAGLSPEQATARLNTWDSRRAEQTSAERRESLMLIPRLGTVPRAAEAMLVFMPLFFAFGLILMIGCANVANLLLARLVKRQREIGVRLAIGASRARVVGQLLTENLLLALIAAILAFLISRLVLTGAVYAMTSSFPPDMGTLRIAVPPADWRVALFLLAAAIVSTLLFALAPALRATRLDVSRAMHSEVMRAGRPGRARDLLVALQVTGSVLLLICAAIFLRSTWAQARIDPGIRTADIVTVSVLNEGRRQAVLDAIGNEQSVAELAAAWPTAVGGISAYGEGSSGRSVVSYQYVSPEYFEVLGVDVVRGRSFADAERNADEPVAVVSETIARELWPGMDPLGQEVRVYPDPTIGRPDTGGAAGELPASNQPLLRPRTAVVVGVARDVPGFQIIGTNLGGFGVYLPIGSEATGTTLVTRTLGDLESGRRNLVDRLAAIDPNMTEVETLQMLANVNAYILGTSFWLAFALGILALLLTLSGLYGVLSFVVQQRTKEIGVRMALGASRAKIGGLVVLQSARPVVAGVALGGILTVAFGAVLLATPMAEQIAATVQLFDPVAYAASVVCIVGACAAAALIPALRAGRVNPLTALRED